MLYFRFVFVLALIFLTSCEKKSQNTLTLDVLTHDSILAEGGLGEVLKKEFEAQSSASLRLVSAGDAGQILARVQISSVQPHIVLGLDQTLWMQGKELLEGEFQPYDQGYLTWMVDTEWFQKNNVELPEELSDLLSPKLKRKLVLQDPRTSTPGLAFLILTHKVLGDGAKDFWKKLKKQWLTLTPGWDQAYGLFLKGQAAMVWSYQTSEAYHKKNGDEQGRYRAIFLKEGAALQVEGAALVKKREWTHSERELATQFFKILASNSVQEKIPLTQWMMPIKKDTLLPPEMAALKEPTAKTDLTLQPEELKSLLKSWSQWIE